MRLLLRATHQLSFRLQRAEHEALSQCSRRCAANREHLVPAAPLCCGWVLCVVVQGCAAQDKPHSATGSSSHLLRCRMMASPQAQ